MKAKKILITFVCIFSVVLLYVFGVMYINNRDQGGGSSAANSNSSDGSGAGSANTNSPGNNDTSEQQQTNTGQTANPTGSEQTNFIPNTQQQAIPLPTQPVSAAQQTTGNTNPNSIPQQSQNNSANNSEAQITPNPIGGFQ